MSYQAVDAVLAHSRATGSDRLVLVVLATHADKDRFECFPRRDLLCKEAAMSERNLIYCLKKLEELDEITVQRGSGRGNLTSYTINLPKGEGLKRVQVSAPFTPQERVQDLVKTVQEPAPFEPERVQEPSPFEDGKGCNPASERVQDLVIKGARFGNAYKEEPSWNHHVTVMEEKKDMSDEAPDDVLVSPSAPSPVQEVFAYWKTALNHPRSDLSKKRKSAVNARLSQGYTVEELKQAIDGCRASPWHMGQNPEGTVYDDLTLICRDDNHVRMFISKVRTNGNSQVSKTGTNDANRGTVARTTEDYGIRDCKVL